ncbi:SLOG family protein [Lentzea flaviverrucosa]|uniref:NADAR domain-containing protein n=1 Tax=Lentzea flaviverrucosa TaxID=200379 RepID=A0A1H9XYP7_9PSEU|nr:SLOG family protein [Lentzea flaviverrucosa]RDI16389.1 ribA/ribD-fused uncharacterized protein [Lentzea flaviverrucosa]SES51204.1 conserved hypothetical protein, ribA/ribD-fused [Lentzea flaviverrucosa]
MPIDLTTTDDTQLGVINGFESQFNWLSNFHPSPLTWDGHTFATAEAAFAAGKTLDPALRAQIAAEESPLKAKQLGRRLALRPQWDERYRHNVMGEVLAAKFAEPGLHAKLTATGDRLLIERNDWHDDFWGDCSCPRHRTKLGRNMLGLALMQLRSRLAGTAEDHWPRVALTGHRDIPSQCLEWTLSELARVTVKLRDGHGTRIAISGGARGSDLWWADTAADAGLAVWLYQPFPQQPDRWPAQWQQHHQRVRDRADRVAVLGSVYRTSLLFDRNDWMIRDSNALVAVVDPQHRGGGTHAAVTSALYNTPVIRIDIRVRDTRIIMPR